MTQDPRCLSIDTGSIQDGLANAALLILFFCDFRRGLLLFMAIGWTKDGPKNIGQTSQSGSSVLVLWRFQVWRDVIYGYYRYI